MNSFFKNIAIVGGALILLLGGFILGKEIASRRLSFALEVQAEQDLALTLEVLAALKTGNTEQARWMLETSTAGSFETITQYADFDDGARSVFQCAVMKRYKAYYYENELFSSEKWKSVMMVDGMKEAKLRREAFFENELKSRCP